MKVKFSIIVCGILFLLLTYNNGVYAQSSRVTSPSSKETAPDMPPAPTVTQSCGSTTLTAATPPRGVVYYWQTSSSGTSTLNSSSTYTVTSSKTVYLRSKSTTSGLWSSARSVSVSVKVVPNVPSVSSNSRCGSGTVTLSASTSTSGATVMWYNGTTYIQTGTSYSPNLTSTKTYTVKAYKDGCYSGSKSVTATIKSIPSKPVAADKYRCGGGSITLSATSSTKNATLKWYEGSTYKASGPTYTALLSSSKTFNVKAYKDGCYSSSEAVLAEVRSVPTVPSASDKSRCGSGTITLTASTSTSGASLKWYDGSTYKATGSTYSPSVSSTKTYNVKSYKDGCYSSQKNVTATVKTVPAKPIALDVSRCGSGSVSLTANSSTSGSSIKWYYGSTNVYNGNTYTTNITSTKTYTAKAYLNGCYSTAESVVATVKSIPSVPTASGGSRCGAGTVTLSANTSTSGASLLWYDGSTYKATGSTYSPSVSSTKTYNVKSYKDGCYSGSKNAIATIKTIPTTPSGVDASRCGPGSVTLAALSDPGADIKWYDGTTYKATGINYVTPSLTSSKTYNIKAYKDGCYSGTGTATATIKTVPAIPTASDKSRCGNGNITLTASTSTSGASMDWYYGSSKVGTGPSYTASNVSGTKTYTVKSVLNGCYSTAKSVNATAKLIPAAPIGADQERCGTGTLNLAASTSTIGATLYWYNDGQHVATGTSYSPNLSSSKTYNVKSILSGCSSSYKNITATVKTIPAAPVGTSNERCGGGTVELTASSTTSGALVKWYLNGNHEADGSSFTPLLSETTSYQIKSYLNGCYSSSSNVTAKIKDIPAVPAVTHDAICGPGTVELSASSTTSGALIYWYQGSTYKAMGINYSPTVSGTTTYNVKSKKDGCYSNATNVIATVKEIPSVPSGISAERCGAGTVILAAISDPDADIKWYDGTTYQATGTNYITPSLTASKSYNIKAYKNGCYSNSSSATATVKTIPAIPNVSSNEICGPGAITLTASTSTTGAVVNWYDGSTYLANGNSYSPTVTATKTYNVRANLDGCNSDSKGVTATVKPVPQVPSITSSNNERCGPGSITLTASSTTGANINWYYNEALQHVGKSFTPSLIASRTFHLNAELNGCNSLKTNVLAKIKEIPQPLVADGERCGPGSLTLQAGATVSGSIIEWFDGTTHIHTGNDYTTPELNSTKEYVVKASNDGCLGSPATVNAVIKAQLNNPIIIPDKSYACGNEQINFMAQNVIAGSTLSWTLNSVNPQTGTSVSYTLPNENNTVKVIASIDGCSAESIRNISKYSVPATPIANDVARIDEGTVALVAQHQVGTTINWYEAGSQASIYTGATFSPYVTSSKSYELESSSDHCKSTRSTVDVTITPLIFEILVSDAQESGIQSDPIVLPGDEGMKTLSLSCNSDWQITHKPEWLTIDKSSGSGNDNIVLTYPISINESPLRSGSLSITAGNSRNKDIYFSQLTKTFNASLVLSKFASKSNESGADISLSPASNHIEFDINSDVDFYVEIENPYAESWMYNYLVDNDNNKVYVDYKANQTANSRNAQLKFKHDDIEILSFGLEQEQVKEYSSATHHLNWVQTTTYGEDGRVTAQSIGYTDKLGKGAQSLSRNLNNESVIVSQTLYDDFNRPVITPLPVPVSQENLNYREEFIDEGNLLASENAQVSTAEDVGYYYSDLNTEEQYVPSDKMPYARVEYSERIPGAVRKSYMVGEVTSQKYSTGFTVVASPDELKEHPLVIAGINPITLKQLSVSPIVDSDFEGMVKNVGKSVTGKETVSYTDANGNTIATCISGESGNELIEVTYVINTTSDGQGGYIDIHLPNNQASYNLTKNTGFNHAVIDLLNDTEVDNGSSAFSNLQPGFYRIICNDPKEVSFDVTLGYKYYAFSAFDHAGRLIRTIAPKDVEEYINGTANISELGNRISRNTYNSLGRLLDTYSQDEGYTEFMYCKDGRIRFSQNARQRVENKLSYTNYDKHGRVVEVGEIHDNDDIFRYDDFRNAQALGYHLERVYEPGEYGLTTDSNILYTHHDQTYTLYDKPDANAPIQQYFVRGKVSKTWNNNTATWYSYNYDGTMASIAQEFNGLDIDNDGLINDLDETNGIEDPDDITLIDYTYDFEGRVIEVKYIAGAMQLVPGLEENMYVSENEFTHYYEYNLNGQLEAVYTQDRYLPKKLQARYYYYAHGPLKRVELGESVQGIDYVYNIHGWLKSINNPTGEDNDPGMDGINGKGKSFEKDVFAMGLDYYNGDYTRTNSNINGQVDAQNFNGNIASQYWKTNTPVNSQDSPSAWQYTYDERNYLARAEFGLYMPSPLPLTNSRFTNDPSNQYAVYGQDSNSDIKYGANGNILYLSRKVNDGTTMDNLSYKYKHGTNQLDFIVDPQRDRVPGVDYPGSDYESYFYDETGRLEANLVDNQYFTYDVYGKTQTVYQNDDPADLIAIYEYDDRGFRIKKEDHKNNLTTWYVRDVGGNILTTYTKENTSEVKRAEVPVYGSERIGLYSLSNDGSVNRYVYELSDHLGNVRATIGKEEDNPYLLLSSTDYYPFGMELPGRTYTLEDYRFGYQGQFAEKDDETGYNQFEARLYDSRIGRWLTTDPAGQFYSPYLGMGNNPIIGYDPDGRITIVPWWQNKRGDIYFNPDANYDPGSRFSLISMDNEFFGETLDLGFGEFNINDVEKGFLVPKDFAQSLMNEKGFILVPLVEIWKNDVINYSIPKGNDPFMLTDDRSTLLERVFVQYVHKDNLWSKKTTTFKFNDYDRKTTGWTMSQREWHTELRIYEYPGIINTEQTKKDFKTVMKWGMDLSDWKDKYREYVKKQMRYHFGL